jgi:hypothetical protein
VCIFGVAFFSSEFIEGHKIGFEVNVFVGVGVLWQSESARLWNEIGAQA